MPARVAPFIVLIGLLIVAATSMFTITEAQVAIRTGDQVGVVAGDPQPAQRGDYDAPEQQHATPGQWCFRHQADHDGMPAGSGGSGRHGIDRCA